MKSKLNSKDVNALKVIANKKRNEIIQYCSANGGYLSSNLSACEITVALNSVFDSNDRVIYCGSEINYTDKLLHARQIDDNEEINALSTALGICASRDIEHKKYNVVAVINSNNSFNGTNVDALNTIGLQKKKMVIVYNDDATIDQGIGFVDKIISNLRNTKTYNEIKGNVKEFLKPQKGGERIIEGIHNIKSNIRKSIVDEGIFGEYNIDYIGPVDGHNMQELLRAFEVAKTKEYPCVVHCITTKGKGLVFAESNTSERWIKCAPFDEYSGKFLVEENENLKCSSKIVSELILKKMDKIKDLCIISSSDKNYANLNELFAKYPDRCFEVGNSVCNALGFGLGLSQEKKIPFISIKSSKLSECFSILTKQIEKFNSQLIINLINDDNSDIEVLNALKNIKILNITNYNDLINSIDHIFEINEPIILRYPDSFMKTNENVENIKINVGKWQKVANNIIEDKVIICSKFDYESIKKIILDNNYKYTLINANYINPIDDVLLDEILIQTKNVYLDSELIKNRIMSKINISDFKADIKLINENDIKSFMDKVRKG